MSSEFVIRLPDPDRAGLPDRIDGVLSMRRFWTTGQAAGLPEDPKALVVFDWLNRMSGDGFEQLLQRIGITHQALMEECLDPISAGNLGRLDQMHTVELMHCLWRIGVQCERSGGAGDLQISDFRNCGGDHLWRKLRERTTDGEDRPSLRWLLHDDREDERLPGPVMRIKLGHPALGYNHELISETIRPALGGDFRSLPEDPEWIEISDLALLIDGYAIGERLRDVGDVVEWFNGFWEQVVKGEDALPSDPLRLMLVLFICQRGYLKEGWGLEEDDGTPTPLGTAIRRVYRELKRSLNDGRVEESGLILVPWRKPNGDVRRGTSGVNVGLMDAREIYRRCAAVVGGMYPEGMCESPLGDALGGRGFFPVASGSFHEEGVRGELRRKLMFVGQDWGNGDFACLLRKDRDADVKSGTGRILKDLIEQAGLPIEECFFTNALFGVRCGDDRMVGRCKGWKDRSFVTVCEEVLRLQIATVKPRGIICLGKSAVEMLARIVPDCGRWKTGTLRSIDERGDGMISLEEPVGGVGLAAILTHPSYRHINARRRRIDEVELLREIWAKVMDD